MKDQVIYEARPKGVYYRVIEIATGKQATTGVYVSVNEAEGIADALNRAWNKGWAARDAQEKAK